MSSDQRRLSLSDLNLDELSLAFTNWEGGLFDPVTGDVYIIGGGEVLGLENPDIDPDAEGWIRIDGDESWTGYRDMEDFTAAVNDPVARERLERSLDGRGAFLRFKNQIAEISEALRRSWFAYSDAVVEIRVIDWLVQIDLISEAEAEADAAKEQRVRGRSRHLTWLLGGDQ
ncbi:hypothetical protein GCM10022381_13400 [Leifsonia kafniensis]|uniref:Uncharacterized protein n=1 Tax=Leifsonia kafniensis TaxID=475957 RepID=A0ABP7KB42_9MICO